jgi:hypothetical protein
MSRGPEPAGRSGIGSSMNSRFQPRSVTGLDRLPQPLHGEFDILRLQVAPALDFGLVPLFREALEILRSQLPGGRALPGELSRMNGSFGIPAIPQAADVECPLYRRRLTITCFRESPSFFALAWTASTDRPISLAISREVFPETASNRSRWSSASVHLGMPTRGRSIISLSP